MDAFNKLPFPQKVAVLVAALAAIAGLFYYAMITPVEEAIVEAQTKEKNLKTELEKLQKEAASLKPDELVKEKQALEAEKLSYVEMLPKNEEIVKFISGLSETATAAGLELVSFEKGKSSNRNFYMQIPIKMEVKGTYRELVGFLRSVAEKDRRVVNVRNLKVVAPELDVSPLMVRYMAQRLESLPKGWALRPMSETQVQMDKLRAMDELVVAGVELTASFDTYVFLYTGTELPAEQKTQLETLTAARMKKIVERRQVPL